MGRPFYDAIVKVVKIEPAKDMYEPHLHLENGDTVLFGSMIQNVKESIDDKGTKNTKNQT